MTALDVSMRKELDAERVVYLEQHDRGAADRRYADQVRTFPTEKPRPIEPTWIEQRREPPRHFVDATNVGTLEGIAIKAAQA